METIKSKITKVSGAGHWDGANGRLYKFEVEMENHDIGQVMTKELEQKRWVVGETIGYTKEVKGNFTNLKRVDEKPGFGGNPNYTRPAFNPAANDKREAMIVIQSSLKEAIQFHHLNGYSEKADSLGAKLKESWATAEWFAKKVLESTLLQSPSPVGASHTADIDKQAEQQKLDAIRNSSKPF